MDIYMDVKTVAELENEDERSIRRKIKKGVYKTRTVEGSGRKGFRYEVHFTSLSPGAQIRYLNEMSDTTKKTCVSDIDMAAYKEKFGAEGMNELLFKCEMVQKALELATKYPGKKTKLLEQLAKDEGIGKRTLDRWIKAYTVRGTAGLMRKIERDSKGKRTSICLEAKRFLMDKYLTKIKRKKTVVYEMLLDYAESSGADACKNCMYREGTKARANLELQGFYDVPLCTESEHTGLKITESAKTISRILKEDISTEILDYARKGRMYWEAAHMQKAVREKPDIVNKCWFGDHHVFDIFVFDEDGKIGKPWLTAWYDIGSGCLVGWCLSMNPNSRTIAEALTYGILEKPDVPFSGVPEVVYTDNGKDYRSHVFEGGKIVEVSVGKMQYNLETEGILKQLHIHNVHAKAYHGWAKPVERWFRTIEEKHIRELPGWCGNHPDQRPEGFEKDLKKLVEKQELLSLDEFMGILTQSILPAYHNSSHDGYKGEKPLERYMRLKKARYDIPSWALLSIAKMESVERTVNTQGIRFANNIYWHNELRHLAGETVKVKYNRERKDVVIIMHKGKFICAATAKETLKMVLEEEEKVSQHVANQKRQENEVRERICELTGRPKPKRLKKATSNVLTGKFNKNSSNITSLDHEKAMSEYEKASQAEEVEVKAEGKIKKRFEEIGQKVLERDVLSS